MGTARILLPVTAGVAPDASGAGNNPATPEKVVSSAAQTANTPKASYVHLLFDPATDEHWEWVVALPSDYAGGGTLRLKWGQKGAAAGNVVWKAGVAVATDLSTDLDSVVFTAADLSTADAAPTTTEQVTTSTITLTMTNAAANRACVLFVGRDADNAADTLAADATLLAVSLDYTTT